MKTTLRLLGVSPLWKVHLEPMLCFTGLAMCCLTGLAKSVIKFRDLQLWVPAQTQAALLHTSFRHNWYKNSMPVELNMHQSQIGHLKPQKRLHQVHSFHFS